MGRGKTECDKPEFSILGNFNFFQKKLRRGHLQHVR